MPRRQITNYLKIKKETHAFLLSTIHAPTPPITKLMSAPTNAIPTPQSAESPTPPKSEIPLNRVDESAVSIEPNEKLPTGFASTIKPRSVFTNTFTIVTMK